MTDQRYRYYVNVTGITQDQIIEVAEKIQDIQPLAEITVHIDPILPGEENI